MSGWVAGAIVVGGVAAAGASVYSANKAADAAGEATEASVRGQSEQLNYLKEINAMPQQFKEQALQKLAGGYGLEGGEGSQQQLIDQARKSPLYGALMGGQQAGEESILRNASATGGLRSGNVQANLADYNTQLQNQALLQSYGQQQAGLQGMAGLQTGTQQIGQVMGGIGQTQAQGIQAQGQAYQQGMQGVTSAIGSTTGNLLYAKGKGII